MKNSRNKMVSQQYDNMLGSLINENQSPKGNAAWKKIKFASKFLNYSKPETDSLTVL